MKNNFLPLLESQWHNKCSSKEYYLFIYVCMHLFIYLFIYLFTYSFIYVFIYLFICLFFYLYLFIIYLFIYLFLISCWRNLFTIKISVPYVIFTLIKIIALSLYIYLYIDIFFYVGFLSHTFTITGQQGKGEAIYSTPLYHFHPLHRHLDIGRAISAESSHLHIGSSRTRTGNLWFPSASR